MLRVGFHPLEDLVTPLGTPAREIAQSGHEPDMRLGIVQEAQFAGEELRLGEIFRHVEAAAIVPGVTIRATDVAADDEVDVLDEGFDAGGHSATRKEVPGEYCRLSWDCLPP